MAQRGATVREVAEALEVTEKTVYEWRNKHQEFGDSFKLGRDAADDRVEESLYRRATGYSFDSIKIMSYEGIAFVEPFVEHVPPDVGAIQFWLKNRRGEVWREKQDVNVSGSVNIAATKHDENL